MSTGSLPIDSTVHVAMNGVTVEDRRVTREEIISALLESPIFWMTPVAERLHLVRFLSSTGDA